MNTNREFLNAVISLAGLEGVSTEIIDYAENALAKLDERNSKRANAPSAIAHKAEIDSFRAKVLALFTSADVALTSNDVAEKLEVSVPKASNALTALAKADVLVKTEIKIPACKAQGIKGGKKMLYQLMTAEDDDFAEDADEIAEGAE